MAAFDRLGRLASQFVELADFLMVYIEEAHPADGWAFRDNVHVRTHRDIKERIAATSFLEAKSDLTLVVDNMDDECNRAYGGLYERLYIVQNGVVAYQGNRGPAGFKVAEVEEWLNKYKNLSTVEAVVPDVAAVSTAA